MPDKIKPGQWIKVTVKENPVTRDDRQTLERLMRMNPSTQNALAKAKSVRAKVTVHRQRAGNIWSQRPEVGKIVRAEEGQEFFLRYRPQIMSDLESVSDLVEYKASDKGPEAN
ncbi:MAG: hypothetical protein ACF8PN_17485 [Phycisphaerales bacterium]